jgi:kynurenine formamidase
MFAPPPFRYGRMWRMTLRFLLVFAILSAACTRAPEVRAGIDRAKLVDLSHAYDEKTIYWPTSPPFSWKRDAWGQSAGGYWYASATFTTSEHGGTHLDSPIHFAEGKWSTAEIPISQLVGPARVIDASSASSADRNYLITRADVEAYEQRAGALAQNDIVLIRTDWSRYWPDRKAYLGSDKPGDTSSLSFPGISREVAELLVERRVAGVGIDTASIDYGRSADFMAHRVLTAANIYALENLDGLSRLPESGATLLALPMKIAGGTGGPVRVVAVLP